MHGLVPKSAVISYLIAYASIVTFRSVSVAPKVHLHVFGAPTLDPPLGSHQGGVHADAVVVAELHRAKTGQSAQPT